MELLIRVLSLRVMLKIFFFLISNSNLLKSAKGRIPYTREVYKRALKRVEQKVNLRSLQK
jgi:hypothetical protein